jgi:hypothetical protein
LLGATKSVCGLTGGSGSVPILENAHGGRACNAIATHVRHEEKALTSGSDVSPYTEHGNTTACGGSLVGDESGGGILVAAVTGSVGDEGGGADSPYRSACADKGAAARGGAPGADAVA